MHRSLAASHVWHLPNVVEHVARYEKQDRDQGDGSPEVAILNDGKNIWESNCHECDATQDGSGGDSNLEVVDRAYEWWMWAIRKSARDPAMNRFRRFDAGGVSVRRSGMLHAPCVVCLPPGEIQSLHDVTWPGMRPRSRVEEDQHGRRLQHHLSLSSAAPRPRFVLEVCVYICVEGRPYRLEGFLSIQKVQCPKHQSRLLRAVSTGPALGQQLPFRLEYIAQMAAKSGVQGSEEDGHGVVAGSLGEMLVGLVVEFHGLCFGMSLFKAISSRS